MDSPSHPPSASPCFPIDKRIGLNDSGPITSLFISVSTSLCLWLVEDVKEKHTMWKLWVEFYSEILLRTIAWETIVLSNSEGTALSGRGGASVYYEFFGWEVHVVKHISWYKITANHKELISQINNFSAFLCMGVFKNLGSLKFFLKYEP